MNTNIHFGALCVCLLALAACKTTTATSFSQSYQNPGYGNTVFKRVLVVGVAQDAAGRKAFEDALASAIASEGGTAAPSYTVLPNDEKFSEDELHAVIERDGVDGVLVTRLLSVDKETENYTPPTQHLNAQTRYYAGGWGYGFGYGGYYGMYGTTFTEIHSPGYFETSTTLKLETNLYSVATNELVWTGQSETIDPDSIEDARESVTKAVAKKLKDQGLIP
jgi:hypothetical protein